MTNTKIQLKYNQRDCSSIKHRGFLVTELHTFERMLSRIPFCGIQLFLSVNQLISMRILSQKVSSL